MRTLQSTVRSVVSSAKTAQPIEWQICDTDAEWHTRQQDALTTTGLQPASTRRPTWLARHWRSGAVLLFVLAITGGWSWRVAQRGIAHIEADLRASIESDLWMTAMQGDSKRAKHFTTNHFTTVQDGTARPHSSTVQSLTLLGESAIVQLVTQPTMDQPAFRQTRFYRQTAEGWVHTQPDAEVWGAPRHLESAHFIFHFRQNDAKVVAAEPAMEP